MTVLMVPELEDADKRWPSLGPQIVDAIEATLVFGPGDLLGQRAVVDPEKRALISRAYEVHPPGSRDANGKPIAGRRRFRRVAISLQKGSAKTELASWIAAMELWHLGPVRCDGFDANGQPVGRPVVSPYVPMVAYTEEQAEDLAFGVLKAILERSQIASDFDIGFERIMRAAGDGKCSALAGAPDSRDGALTTFAHKDETHRWTQERLRRAHRTMLANLTKRIVAEPWELETTTAYAPGQGSVAEDTADYAQAVAEGRIADSKLFFFHRQARDGYDWHDPEQRREALIEAAGPSAAWKDIEGIGEHWQDPKADFEYLERVFGNRPIATASQAFNSTRWQENARPKTTIAEREKIALGFDGSKSDDATALIGTHLQTGFQWPLGIWEHPGDGRPWEVPRDQVNGAVDEAFEVFDVCLMLADPSWWDTELARWQGQHGTKVQAFDPRVQRRKMAIAVKAYAGAIEMGDVTHDGDARFARHIGNAHREPTTYFDDDGTPLYQLRKERYGSPKKFDAAMAAVLSWAARNIAIAHGALNQVAGGISVYVPE